MKRSLLAFLIFICAVAYADDAIPKYQPGTSGVYREGIAVVDSAALDGVNDLALPTIPTNNNQVIRVTCLFSVASATCKLHYVRCDGSKRPVDKTSTTATADANLTIRSKYVADSIAFDSGSFPYARILAEAPSSGTVDLIVTVCGQ